MSRSLRLNAELEPHGPAGAFVLTDEQVADLGEGRKAFPVQVSVNGVTLRLRLARMGGMNLIGLAKAARAEAGVELGQRYDVVVARDAAERSVEVPADLAAALTTEPAVEAKFAAMSFTHRREYVRWIEEAKQQATREGRIAKALEMIRDGRTH